MSTELTFLDEEAKREWVLRMERACEAEHKRHRGKEGEIRADSTNRGLLNSTVFSGALRDEQLSHLRQLIRIAREELFAVVEGRNIRLEESDGKAITAYLTDTFRNRGEQIQEEQRTFARERRLSSLAGQPLQMAIDQAIHAEAVAEVSVRATALRRKLDKERKKWWSERVEKFVWSILCVLIGVLGTLFLQWLTKGSG